MLLSFELFPDPAMLTPSFFTSDMSLDENKQQPDHIQYPDDIAADIIVVRDGLMYVYTGSPRIVVPRIGWRSTGDGSKQTPVFSIPPRQRHTSLFLPQSIHRCAGRRVRPYDDKEYKWLRAFLKVVRWMEINLDVSAESSVSLAAIVSIPT